MVGTDVKKAQLFLANLDVATNHVEQFLKYLDTCPIYLNSFLTSGKNNLAVMLVGENKKFPSVLIVPNWEVLESYAKSNGISSSRKDLCQNSKILDMMLKEVNRLTPDLAQYEKIKKVALIESEFTIENGELTPTQKVKRRIVEDHYKDVIEKMYQGGKD